jgi:hypothetical protein
MGALEKAYEIIHLSNLPIPGFENPGKFLLIPPISKFLNHLSNPSSHLKLKIELPSRLDNGEFAHHSVFRWGIMRPMQWAKRTENIQ